MRAGGRVHAARQRTGGSSLQAVAWDPNGAGARAPPSGKGSRTGYVATSVIGMGLRITYILSLCTGIRRPAANCRTGSWELVITYSHPPGDRSGPRRADQDGGVGPNP